MAASTRSRTCVWRRLDTRLGPSTYRYQSLVDGKVRFGARLSVDRDGAVQRYARLFQRLE
jgi:hypothetical protein